MRHFLGALIGVALCLVFGPSAQAQEKFTTGPNGDCSVLSQPYVSNGIATSQAYPGVMDTSGRQCANTGIIQATASVPINVSTATTTQLVALSAGKAIYVTALDVIAGGTGNITFEYGTGSNCGTGTTALTGPYNLTAQTGLTKGAIGPVLIVPAGNALCVLTSAAVQMSGSVSYAQF